VQTKLVVERNLSFFTLFYQYLIQLLPVAILASLFFKGRIQFGEISQATSAFNSVLDDCSLVVLPVREHLRVLRCCRAPG